MDGIWSRGNKAPAVDAHDRGGEAKGASNKANRSLSAPLLNGTEFTKVTYSLVQKRFLIITTHMYTRCPSMKQTRKNFSKSLLLTASSVT
jgi:hypothetical protein